VTYGEPYAIERLEGSQWVSCAKQEETVFITIGYLLEPGKEHTKTYRISDLFDVSKPGTYRFKTTCYVAAKGKSEDCTLWAEFAVGDVESPEESKKTGTKVNWRAQYIRTNGYQPDGIFPRAQTINSLQELKDYYNTWHEVFYLERREKVHSDTAIGFLDACDQYDETFFEDNYLIFVLLEESSGSIGHEVRGVQQTADKKISISIDRKIPKVGTCDMAEWHIILELSRDVAVQTPSDVLLYLDGNLLWDGGPRYPVMPIAAVKEPPNGILITPEGETALAAGGYHWHCQLGNGLAEATIADQACRPLPKEMLKPVTISDKHAETVYAPVPGSNSYAPTNCLGYFLKVSWDVSPTSVTYTCWPEEIWQKQNTQEESVVFLNDFAFYAKPGGYIYEIAATWDDTGLGYHGTANYYVYIIGGNEVP